MYSEKVMEHFKNPKNSGKLDNPDAVGEVGNPTCGDVMKIYIKIEKKSIIKDIKFETFGCVAAIATSSALTEMVKGKTIEEALKITKSDISNELGNLPAIKIHCSVLATEALAEAVYNYYKKNNIKIPAELEKKHKIIMKENKEAEKKHKSYCEVDKI